MKWLFYVIVLVYMFYRTVYGLKPVENHLTVERVTYGDNDFLTVGGHKTISCKSSNRNQKVEWRDPNGHEIKRNPGGRIFSQEHFVRGRAPALVLTISRASVKDSGVYQCRSGDLAQNVSLCVIEPSDFSDTPVEVVADLGRSITLSCQAKGDPEPTITWFRNYETISDDDSAAKYRVMTKYNIQGFEGLLTVTSLEPEDSGVYSCISNQESNEAENCTHTSMFNITLNVNYPPTFDDSNKTQFVYGKVNQEIDIICSANGYPAPTFRFFKELTDDVLFEFDKKQIKLIEDTKAVLTVVANQTTFGQRFKCQASNEHGESEKYFHIMKVQKPKTPYEVTLLEAFSNSVSLKVTWELEIDFPISAFEVQYMKEVRDKRYIAVPHNAAWHKSLQVEIKYEEGSKETVDLTSNGLAVILNNLEADSSYWIRLRVTNEIGESTWSNSLLGTTKPEEEKIPESEPEPEPEPEPKVAVDEEPMADATFYGIFFAGGIFVVSFVCMFAMRMVK